MNRSRLDDNDKTDEDDSKKDASNRDEDEVHSTFPRSREC